VPDGTADETTKQRAAARADVRRRSIDLVITGHLVTHVRDAAYATGTIRRVCGAR
jgi:hypothetical protein